VVSVSAETVWLATTAPAAPQASVSGTDITVSWVAPANGGSEITGYTVELSSNGAVVDSATVGGDALTATFSGLGYSTAYSATVVATNEVGSSAVSEASGSVVTGGPTVAPATTVTSDDLTAETQNGLAVEPGSVKQNGTAVITGLKAGAWYFVTAFSDPVQLGWFRANADGEISLSLGGVVPGDHRLAVQDVDGELVGWAAVTVTAVEGAVPGGGNETVAGGVVATAGTTPSRAARSQTLPNTGLEVGGWIALSGVLLLAGAVLTIARRRTALNS
jgi:LPXTG-motif cell wall-anchored protein